MKMIWFAVVSLLFIGANAQIISSGGCPNVTVEQQFDLPNYLNRWYEQKKFFTYFEQKGTCISATYSANDNGTVEVRNYLVNEDTLEVETIVGHATVDSDSGEGKLLVNFPSVGSFDAPYWILGTDYVSYSVVWSCAQVLGDNLQYSWVLTRERYPDALTLALADQVIRDNQLQEDKYLITAHENCPLDP